MKDINVTSLQSTLLSHFQETNWKNILIGVVVGAVLLSSGGYLVYNVYQTKQKEQDIVTPKATIPDWKIHESNVFKYSIEYPMDWSYSPPNPTDFFYSPNTNDGLPIFAGISREPIEGSDDLEVWKKVSKEGLTNVSEGSTTVGGTSGTLITGNKVLNNVKYYFEYTYVKRSKSKFLIQWNDSPTKEDTEKFHKILSTLKFLE